MDEELREEMIEYIIENGKMLDEMLRLNIKLLKLIDKLSSTKENV